MISSGHSSAIESIKWGSTDLSQVVVTKDKLHEKREKSRAQEAKIGREEMYGRWRRNDITGRSPITAAIGLALTPIAVAWAALTMFIYLMLSILKFGFKIVGGLVGGKKSLITGEKAD